MSAHSPSHASSPFGSPRGVRGWLAGALMARVNAPMNALLVERLALRPAERVLEVGCGHGRTLAEIARRVPDGLAAGIDPSAVMVRQSARRNRAGLRSGRVVLHRAAVEAIPHADTSFHKALAANCFQFWSDRLACLDEVRRVLLPGGLLLLGIRVHDPDAPKITGPGFTEEALEEVRAALARAGFEDVGEERHRAGVREVACVSGRTRA